MAYNPSLGVVAAGAGDAVRLPRRNQAPTRWIGSDQINHVRDREDRWQAVPRRAGPDPARRAPCRRRGRDVALEPILYRSDEAVFDSAGLKKVKVTAKVLAHERGEKLRVFKFKPKRGYKRRNGHRQELTRIEVTDISIGRRGESGLRQDHGQARGGRQACGGETGRQTGCCESRRTGRRRQRMAHKKGLGSSRNGRESNAQRLGVKTFAGETVSGGEIIVRQRGTKFKPGEGVGIGKDDTLYARAAGTVQFSTSRRGRVVSVLSGE